MLAARGPEAASITCHIVLLPHTSPAFRPTLHASRLEIQVPALEIPVPALTTSYPCARAGCCRSAATQSTSTCRQRPQRLFPAGRLYVHTHWRQITHNQARISSAHPLPQKPSTRPVSGTGSESRKEPSTISVYVLPGWRQAH